eukprot:6211471-Pleurochrysis_carterae.AAC.1
MLGRQKRTGEVAVRNAWEGKEAGGRDGKRGREGRRGDRGYVNGRVRAHDVEKARAGESGEKKHGWSKKMAGEKGWRERRNGGWRR